MFHFLRWTYTTVTITWALVPAKRSIRLRITGYTVPHAIGVVRDSRPSRERGSAKSGGTTPGSAGHRALAVDMQGSESNATPFPYVNSGNPAH